MEDPDRDVVPLRFAYRVVGRDDGLLVSNRRVGHIVEVTAASLGPCPAQRPRRNGYLILAGAHHRFEGDGAAPILLRFDVVEREDQRTRREPVLSPVVALRSSRRD